MWCYVQRGNYYSTINTRSMTDGTHATGRTTWHILLARTKLAVFGPCCHCGHHRVHVGTCGQLLLPHPPPPTLTRGPGCGPHMSVTSPRGGKRAPLWQWVAETEEIQVKTVGGVAPVRVSLAGGAHRPQHESPRGPDSFSFFLAFSWGGVIIRIDDTMTSG